jgi:tetratricopeptide (TPR) repeat protein
VRRAEHGLDRPLRVLTILKKHEEAERYYRSALRLKKIVLGPRHPDVGISLNNLGELYRKLGRVAEARAAQASAVAILRHALGPRHPHTVAAVVNYRRSRAGADSPPGG